VCKQSLTLFSTLMPARFLSGRIQSSSSPVSLKQVREYPLITSIDLDSFLLSSLQVVFGDAKEKAPICSSVIGSSRPFP